MKKLLATILFFLFPVIVHGAIALDATSTKRCGSACTALITDAHSIVSTTNGVICVFADAYGGAPNTVSSMKANGVDMTFQGRQTTTGDTGNTAEIWCTTAAATSTGTMTIKTTWANTPATNNVTVASFTGANSASPVRAVGKGTSPAAFGKTASSSVVSVANDMIFDGVCAGGASGVVSPGSWQTKLQLSNFGNGSGCDNVASSDHLATTTTSYTQWSVNTSAADEWLNLSVSLIPASGVTPVASPPGHFIFKGAKFRLKSNLFRLK